MRGLRAVSETLLTLAVAGLFLLVSAFGMSTIARAQDGQQGGGLLRFLFQRSEPRVREAPRQIAPESQRQRPRQQRQQPRRAAATPTAPASSAVAKSEDASRVLVVGDFLAGALADGLTEAFAENPDVLIRGRSNGSSGLVRHDYYNWPGTIDGIIEAENPKVIIILIGSNDRQQMNVGGARERLRSDGWTREYEIRATALAKAAAARNVPLVWVGTLPFRPTSMSSDMLAFNDIYRRAAEGHGGEFVDVWDGFVDEDGAFVTHGPDMNGQPAQLRASDGINVTRAGRRKMAFYVEKPLGRLLGGGPGPRVAALPDADGLDADGEPLGDGETIARTMPVSLVRPEPMAGKELLGAMTARTNDAEPRTLAERLSREGIAPPRQSGRADDFGPRQKPGAAAPAALQENAARSGRLSEWQMLLP